MSKYRIYFEAGASLSVEVEADDFEGAVELAYDDLPGSICAQCSGWGQSWDLDLGDWDVDESAHEVDGEYVEVKKS